MTTVPEHGHGRKILNFRPSESVHAFARAEAARQGIRVGEYLTHLLLKDRERIEALGRK